MRRTFVTLAATIGLLFGMALPAWAFEIEPVHIVHTERVQAGPYDITVGFSTWPLRAMQSLDFTFTPDGGIAGKSGVIEAIGPEAQHMSGVVEAIGPEAGYTMPLARHPRMREVWGLDVQSLPEPGNWTFRFIVDGPDGKGVGELRNLDLLEQPGPPLGVSWAISTLPLLGLIVVIVVAWRRVPTTRSGGARPVS